MSNICHKCIYHEKCMAYRYNNLRTKYMKKIHTQKTREGYTVIYVEKCSKFTERMFKYYPEKLRKRKSKKVLTK